MRNVCKQMRNDNKPSDDEFHGSIFIQFSEKRNQVKLFSKIFFFFLAKSDKSFQIAVRQKKLEMDSP